MLRLLSVLLLVAECCGAELTGQEIFNRVRDNVAKQLAAAANYTCVQSTERVYYYESQKQKPGCSGRLESKPDKPTFRDRLRLDVAVSDKEEIFSWHAGSNFSSLGITDIVKSGPISSGSFIGYLQNIFLTRGVEVRYNGPSTEAGGGYQFSYNVPLKSSGYRIETKNGSFTVPFLGRFSAGKESFQLETLTVAADNIPSRSEVCAADTEISYQMVPISGKPSLIPKSFQLHMADERALETTSTTEYTQCREFRGESTLRFDFDDSPKAQAATAIHNEWLPANVDLHVRLNTPLDDKTTFAGDPVEGVLLDAVHVKSAGVTIPRGAILQGVVSKMELHYRPSRYYDVSVRFDQLTFGQNSFLLDASPKLYFPQGRRLTPSYLSRLPIQRDGENHTGSFVWPSNHFHTDQHFSAYWETAAPPASAKRVSQ